MLAPRYLYFFCFAALAAPGRFVSVFFRSLGLGDAQIGLVMSLPTLLSVASALAGGVLADTSADGKRRTMLCGTAASACLFLCILPSSSLLGRDAPARLATIALFYTLARAASSPTMSALDAYTLEFLVGRYGAGAKKRYGGERLWGAVSWGIISIVIGLTVDRVGFNALFGYNFFASAALAISLFDWPFGAAAAERSGGGSEEEPLLMASREASAESVADAFRLKGEDGFGEVGESGAKSEEVGFGRSDAAGDWDVDEGRSLDGTEAGVYGCDSRVESETAVGNDENGREQSFFEFVIFLFSRMDSLAFLFTMACISVGTSQVEGLYFLFLDDIGSSNTLLGFSVAVTVIFEIPLFFYGDALSSRFSGRSLLLMGMGFYVARVLYYTLITEPWMVLLVEPLHGVTFSFVQMAAVLEMSRLGPPNLQTTAQSVLSIARMLGSVLGTVGGGILMEKYGAPTAYRAAAALVTASAAFYAWTTRASVTESKGPPVHAGMKIIV